MKTTFIYILDPRNGIPRYLGKSNNPKNRLKGHINEANKNKFDHKNNWVRSLLKDGIRPQLFILDEVPINEWQFWEMHYGHLFLSWGFDMVFDREYLGVGTHILNNSQIEKSKKRRKISKAGRSKIKEGVRKRVDNPTQSMKDMWKKLGAREFGIPSGTKGIKMSKETRKKMSESHKGDRASWFGKKHTEEMKEKNRVKHTGKKASDKTKQKMSESQKKRWQIYRERNKKP